MGTNSPTLDRPKLAASPTGEILIYEPIGWDLFGGVTARDVAELLGKTPRADVLVRLNSPGGSAVEGIAIFNRLKSHRGRVDVQVDGEASSAASLVAMAGETITMAQGATMMVHEPWGVAVGNAGEIRVEADYLDLIGRQAVSIYAGRTGIDPAELVELMAAETWFDGAAAIEAGFADEVVDAPAVAAYRDRSRFKFKHPAYIEPLLPAASSQIPSARPLASPVPSIVTSPGTRTLAPPGAVKSTVRAVAELGERLARAMAGL